MSERELKICRRHSSGRDEWVPLDDKPNSDAPSVAEVMEALHDGRDAAETAMNACANAESPKEQEYADIAIRLNNLIARLEDK